MCDFDVLQFGLLLVKINLKFLDLHILYVGNFMHTYSYTYSHYNQRTKSKKIIIQKQYFYSGFLKSSSCKRIDTNDIMFLYTSDQKYSMTYQCSTRQAYKFIYVITLILLNYYWCPRIIVSAMTISHVCVDICVYI